MNLKPGAPIWTELFTRDLDAASAYYGEVFGWSARSTGPDFGGYVQFECDGDVVAGAMANDGSSEAPNAWSVYLASTDASATVERATKAGAEVQVDLMDVGDLGRAAMLRDPAGASVGVWQPGTHQGIGGIGKLNHPNWFELHTLDFAGALRFYPEAFGVEWDDQSSEGFNYATYGRDEAAVCGVMDDTLFRTEGPSYWTLYLRVEDTDAAVAAGERAGGSTLRPAADSPFGRLAVLTDPTGAPFSVMDDRRS